MLFTERIRIDFRGLGPFPIVGALDGGPLMSLVDFKIW